MNELAHVVHELVTGQNATRKAELSRLERQALTDLQSLLRQPPEVLSRVLAQNPSPEDWLRLHRPVAFESSLERA